MPETRSIDSCRSRAKGREATLWRLWADPAGSTEAAAGASEPVGHCRNWLPEGHCRNWPSAARRVPGAWPPRRRRAVLVAIVAPILERGVAARTQPPVFLDLLPARGLWLSMRAIVGIAGWAGRLFGLRQLLEQRTGALELSSSWLFPWRPHILLAPLNNAGISDRHKGVGAVDYQ